MHCSLTFLSRVFWILLISSFTPLSMSSKAHGSPQPIQWNYSKCYDFNAFGADPSGVNDNTPAWNSLIAIIQGKNACISFGAGTYLFSSAISYTATNDSSIAVIGQGPGVTQLVFPSSSGLSITGPSQKNSISIANISFKTSQTRAGTALTLIGNGNSSDQAPSFIQNVDITGTDYPMGTTTWQTGLSVSNFANLAVYGGHFSGPAVYHSSGTIGVNLTGSSTGPLYSYQISFFGTWFVGWGTGINYGTYVQGVNLVSVGMAGMDYDIQVPIGASQSGLFVSNSNFSCLVTCINILGAIDPINISNNALQGGGSGANMINISQVADGAISGNWMNTDGGYGIQLANGSPTSFLNVADNAINLSSPAINILSSAQGIDVHDNNCASGNASCIINAVANAATNRVRVHDNLGQPYGPTPITPTGSPFTTTPLAYGATFLITGGTVSSVTMFMPETGSVIVCSSSPCQVFIPAWGSVILTYSAAPTIYNIGQ